MAQSDSASNEGFGAILNCAFITLIALYLFRVSGVLAAVALLAFASHECGHIWAMFRCRKYFDGMAIFPLRHLARLEKANDRADFSYVAIMGPIWCFLAALICLVAHAATGIVHFGVCAFFIGLLNFFNLMPVNFFDGGKVMGAVAYSIHPGHFRSFNHVSVGFLFLMAFLHSSWILALMAVFSWMVAGRDWSMAVQQCIAVQKNGEVKLRMICHYEPMALPQLLFTVAILCMVFIGNNALMYYLAEKQEIMEGVKKLMEMIF